MECVVDRQALVLEAIRVLKPVIVHLNGWPGVGKLTVGRRLARRLDGLLLDNHAILNVPAALTVPGSPEFHETARAVRAVAFDRILALPPSTPVVLTNVVARGGTSSGFLEENWRAVLRLAARRGCGLFAVTLTCAPDEHADRIGRRAARSGRLPSSANSSRRGCCSTTAPPSVFTSTTPQVPRMSAPT